MGQLVLLVVAAVWAAVLVPPLLRSRIENRPNSSVSDFRDQLSSLQRAMPSRGVAMRSMARPLAPSPLSRPAAAGRPNLNAHGRTHGGTPARLNHQPVAERRRRPEPVRATYDATPRVRSHAERSARPVSSRDAVKRRRANVLFVLALLAASTLFLAAVIRSQPMIWAAVAALGVLLGYVCMLGQLRQREAAPAPAPAVRASRRTAPESQRTAPEPRRHLAERPAPTRQVASRQVTTRQAPRASAVRRSTDRWSHAV